MIARGISRQINEQAVLDQVLADGPVSRAALARILGLSKPTINSIIKDLQGLGIIRVEGQSNGHVGRTAALYCVNEQVGCVMGVDVGGTKLNAVAANLLGVVLAEILEPTDTRSADQLIEQIVRIRLELSVKAGIPSTDIRVVTIGMPGIIDPENRLITHAPNLPLQSASDFLARLEAALPGNSIQAFNDVNLAAIGERWRGLGQRISDFAFLSIGTGVGLGLVINGELCEGFRGQAGEVGWLPLGGDPFDEANREHGALEERVSGRAMTRHLRRLIEQGRQTSLAPDSAPTEIFAAATLGDTVADEVLDDAAKHIALAIAAICSVVGPELVVLGGGIGSNEDFVGRVQAYLPSVTPLSTRVEPTALGARAALMGSLSVALREGRSQMLTWAE